jgi:hypothetical protein
MKLYRIITILLMLALFPIMAQATTYTFTPYDTSSPRSDVFDLDHNYLYIWGIKSPIPSNEVLVSATISIKNINNWDNNYNILKFYLVDNPKISDIANTVDIISISDSERTTASNEVPYYLGTRFTDYMTLGTTFQDTNGTGYVNQFSYSFNASELQELTQYLGTANTFAGMNADFGIAFDPDCHFYNDGITLTITTRAVPEPTALLFLGLGLVGLAGIGRKLKK